LVAKYVLPKLNEVAQKSDECLDCFYNNPFLVDSKNALMDDISLTSIIANIHMDGRPNKLVFTQICLSQSSVNIATMFGIHQSVFPHPKVEQL